MTRRKGRKKSTGRNIPGYVSQQTASRMNRKITEMRKSIDMAGTLIMLAGEVVGEGRWQECSAIWLDRVGLLDRILKSEHSFVQYEEFIAAMDRDGIHD